MAINILAQVLEDPTLDGKRKLILLAIANASDRDGVGFCSYTQIKQVTHVTDEYLRVSIARLIEEGRLEIVQKGTGPGRATVYRVLVPTAHSTELPNSVGENSPTPTGQLPNSDDPNSPTQLGRTPQLRQVNSPTPPSNHPSCTSLQTPPLQTPPSGTVDAALFDAFWSTYPRRSGKRVARTAFTNALRRASATTILTAAARYRDDPNRVDAYTALPATWLNQDRWDDDPLPARESPNPRATHASEVLAFAAAKQARLEQLGIA